MPPSWRLETISVNKEFHLPFSRLVLHSHLKVFAPPPIPSPSPLHSNCLLTCALQVKTYIWRALCKSYNWGLVMHLQPTLAIIVFSSRHLIWPGHMYEQSQTHSYQTDRKLNTSCYMDTLSHTQAITIICTLSQRARHGLNTSVYLCIWQIGVLKPFYNREECLWGFFWRGLFPAL